MPTRSRFIGRHAVPTYFVLAFAVSWGGVLLVACPGAIPGTAEQLDRLFPFALLAMLAGPSVAGIVLTALVHGRAGLCEVRSRLFRWRVGARWYAVALLTSPLSAMAVLLALSINSAAFVPGVFASDDKTSVLLFGLGVGLMAGFFEELGWTGFAVPALRRRCRVLTTGLVVGILWGVWHFQVNFWAAAVSAGSLPLQLYLPATLLGAVVQLTGYRVLMVWVYDRTGSLLVAMLMHFVHTASLLVLGPLAMSGIGLLVWNLAWAGVLWAVVAVAAPWTKQGGRDTRLRVRA
jgi:membrane protease YdiL (CAAX protease family)